MVKKLSQGIVVDLDRCVGCYACELACKQENALPEGASWIHVVGFGPMRLDGKMCMDFYLDIAEECGFCGECISICPTQAIKQCNSKRDILELLRSGKRYQICKTR